VHFALLTDFRDADCETLPEDEPLLGLVGEGIEALNSKYADDPVAATAATFFLFHRPRCWNPQERMWMGYERKRGKLADLNRYLRGGARDRFALIVGQTAALAGVRYVITLDTDTQLPRDTVRQLVGAMAHPLNRARLAVAGSPGTAASISDGYAILQPRVAVSLPGTNRSRYARLFGGEPGIDRLGVVQAAQEQSRADQQHQRQRDLRDHQSVTNIEAPASLYRSRSFIFQRRNQISPGSLQRGRESKDDSCRKRQREREREHAPIQAVV